jgi:thiol-disulfide isomerase/thioredoxin
MRFVASLLGLVPATVLAAASPSGAERAADAGRSLVGTAAPRLVVTTIDGEHIDLGRLYDTKAVYLKFWATWCVPCREQMPHLERAYLTAGSDLAVIAINAGFDDTLADVREYRQRLGLTMPIVLDDGRLDAAFHLRVTPQHIVIARGGRILYVGHLADAPLEEALRAARGGASSDAAATTATAVAPVVPAARYQLGDRVPELTVRTLAGGTFHLGSSGTTTVLAFLSPWCESYLKSSRPQLAANCRAAREQSETHAADTGLRWLGIASGLWASPEDLSSYREQYHITIPLTLDASGRLFREFRVMTVPTLVLIDSNGRIVRRVAGADAGSPDALRALAIPTAARDELP